MVVFTTSGFIRRVLSKNRSKKLLLSLTKETSILAQGDWATNLIWA